ncbi:acyl-CoA dehydrogenase family protein [Mycobacterium sp. 29Ha]|uniref:acyl-CoA dehydrogenase family protein n=1 Tax=Mycobacterium sp. 29Ha TaxID=2939268 RepID=UPI002938F025|nr:acyl-CoA dehydrogenase family protein [Mycobacterium sp. 29Ha]MDV3132078.1 acyl-CoA/acyl-ACP dehydrogenase [Mycobacterium sp. 29Ha]
MTGAAAEVDLFLSTTRAFLDREASIERVREMHSRGDTYDRDWWRKAAELGWTSLLVPDELGGGSVSGNGVADLALVAEQIGRTVAPGPLMPVSAVLAGLVDASNSTQHTEMIAALIEGTAVSAWAVDEPGAPFGAVPTTVATEWANGYRIDGVKDRVEAGIGCDSYLVTARAADRPIQLMVPADAKGVTVEPVASIDLVRDYATVRFDGVEVDADAVVGTSDETLDLIARQSQIAQLLQTCEMLGILDAVFAKTVEWALERHSFGRPLASYQALKHRFADLKTQLEACRAIAALATRHVSARAVDAALTVSAAKAYIGEHSVAIVQDCIQLHGGIGVTWEHDLHLFLRRIEVNRAMFGTTEEHQENVFALSEKSGKTR